VAYATTDDVVLAEVVSAAVKTRVHWQHGMVIAPLLAQGAVAGAPGAKLDAVTAAMGGAQRFLPKVLSGTESSPVVP
jgi:hypothetical protein